jgi:hypothetical protein
MPETEQWTEETAVRRVLEEVARQDRVHGPFSNDAASVRFAVACLEDEVREARESWDKWKRLPDWYGVRAEVVQAAAIAIRLARDVSVEVTD